LEGLLWYIFPVERLVGLFRVELFFPAKKAQDDRREVRGVGPMASTLVEILYYSSLHKIQTPLPPKSQW
jgi:hypothetical protein